MSNDNNLQPHLVHTHDVQLDSDYTQWLVELKARYRSAQIKAAVRVNAEKLLFNRRSSERRAKLACAIPSRV